MDIIFKTVDGPPKLNKDGNRIFKIKPITEEGINFLQFHSSIQSLKQLHFQCPLSVYNKICLQRNS